MAIIDQLPLLRLVGVGEKAGQGLLAQSDISDLTTFKLYKNTLTVFCTIVKTAHGCISVKTLPYLHGVS